MLPVNPSTFSFPLGGSEWGGGGWTGAYVRFHCAPPSPIAYVQHSRFAICQHHTRRHETHTIYAFILIRAISSQAVCLHVRSRTWSSPLSQHGASPDGRRVGSDEAMVRTGTTSQTYPWRNFSETRGERNRSAKDLGDPAGVPWLYTFTWSRRDAWPEAELKQSTGGPSQRCQETLGREGRCRI